MAVAIYDKKAYGTLNAGNHCPTGKNKQAAKITSGIPKLRR